MGTTRISMVKLFKASRLIQENFDERVNNALLMIDTIKSLVIDAQPYRYEWINTHLREDVVENNPRVFNNHGTQLDGYVVLPKVL